jgi:hypothetical protein
MRINESSFKKLYREYQESGLSVRDFCANQNFAVSTFYNKKKQLESKESIPEFIPLHIGDQAIVRTDTHTEIALPNEVPINEGNCLEFTFPNGTKLQVSGQIDLALLKNIVHMF